MHDALQQYREVWLVDFEFTAPPGERPTPLCVVARELRSGRQVRLWLADGEAPARPPYPTGDDVLFVAFYASAELGCHQALGWPMPTRILDLYAEFRNCTNGLMLPCGNGLIGALTYFGLPSLDSAEKESLRQLAIRGGPYSAAERAALFDYCQTDVDALGQLLPVMLSAIDLPRALLRGRYMAAAARMEWTGVPVDAESLHRLRENWCWIRTEVVAAVNADYGVFDGTQFVAARWEDYLARHGIVWPRLESGALALDDETFREIARRHPSEVGPIREARYTMSQLRLNDLAVGRDGRNRCLVSAFASRTGHNQPSNSRFIFGPSCWFRSLIRSDVGRHLAYCDWSQQEFGIAAALSSDSAMMTAYESGDPYLTFAKQAGAVPAGATKHSHPVEREQFKVCALAVQYGMGDESLARKLGVPNCRARQLLELHRRTYPRYWRWSDGVADEAMLTGRLRTVFGWHVFVGPDANPRSLRNFPMQANGAEMMRLAACLATERGIKVCCPVHDAFLIEAHDDEIDAEVARMQACMREASEVVLAGFPLRSEKKIVRYPDRYSDPRGESMWRTVQRLLDGRDTPCTGAPQLPAPVHPPPSLISSRSY
jgi:hypothetical protein